MASKMVKVLPKGMRYPARPLHSEKGTNAGKSRFAYCCRECGPGTNGWGVEYFADPMKLPKTCPGGHRLKVKGV